jgi:predicted nuclease with RNAse H fold
MIIGIDCAAQPANTGLVLAAADGEILEVLEARCGSRRATPAVVLADWIRASDRALLALDAPLGWPSPLGAALADHAAGGPLSPGAHALFRRLTDDVILARLGRRPLDIGADRIARAAHAALRLLEDLRQTLGLEIPLAWSRDWPARVAAIEVYPAATRTGLFLPRNRSSLDGLESRLRFTPALSLDSEHVRDAVLCALTGLEFQLGRTAAPTSEQKPRALKEGWIWAPKQPAQPR